MPDGFTTPLPAAQAARQGPVEAVRGIDLTVREAEILGFLGPNGAGKTTTLRMLTTLLAPTGGTASVAGCDLTSDPVGVRRACGYVAQSGGADPNIGVREELVTQGRPYRLTKDQAAVRAEELARDLGFADLLDHKVGALSGGRRRRLDIAMALTHGPKVLCLDEADALADRLVIVDKGVVVAEGTPGALKLRHGGSIDATLQETFLAITGRAPAPAGAAPYPYPYP
ncbi:ATP-binding cassette domain-containing protein [Streptomyces sp. W16]|uniref:ATP-binding cassette domain-containing protein n=1 Tax=Streptomyces sp. W16 TaxID=3076631 RepID=UPI00295B3D69|nr:ATP-binding cassette domain-containing protein [Streptomyces sp. W16]MDV9177232.1 ATP-binding cassette domain-containing protein [Streptomyces sp. W16]